MQIGIKFQGSFFLTNLGLNSFIFMFSAFRFKFTTVFCSIDNKSHSATVTHWGRVTHICVGKLTIVGSDNGLLPRRRQAIIWTSAGILLLGPLGTNCSEILIGFKLFSFRKMHWKMLSGKWQPFCLGLNVLSSMAAVATVLPKYSLYWTSFIPIYYIHCGKH